MPRLPSILLVLGLWIPNCLAEDIGKVSLRFLSFPKSLDPVSVELRLTEEKTVPIQAPSNEFSRPLDVVSAGVWTVGETTESPEGKPVFREYGRTAALASPQQMLILVRKGRANADGFDLIALDGRATAFGGGRFLFLNAAKVDVAGTVGEEKFVVKPGQNMVIQPAARDGKDIAHAMFYFRKDNEARPFFSSRWPVGGQVRNLVFFYHDPETMHLRMHTVRDFL